jgi:hypothetical protein
MSLSVQFVYDKPQRETVSILSTLYTSCNSASFVVGFMTVEGIDALLQPIQNDVSKITSIVIGAGTYRAFDAFDRLRALGVVPERLRVHLGHSRPTTTGARYSFYRYHPMLHSKVYLFERSNGTTAAFVGSHNVTGFALCGLNGEAGVLLEGASTEAVFADMHAHVSAASNGSVVYDPAQRDAYAWWAGQFMEGFADKFDDLPREGEGKNTIVILAESSETTLPATDDVVYFELPTALRLQSLRAEVHLYVFDSLPSSPFEALGQLASAKASFWCRTIGIEDDRGGRELRAAWQITGARPVLRRAPRPFRPNPGVDMQQVRVKVVGAVFGNFEYLFERGKPAFEPTFDREQELRLAAEFSERSEALKVVPPEHLPWFRVTGLQRKAEPTEEDAYHTVLRKLSPGEGAFVLVSVRRRERAK